MKNLKVLLAVLATLFFVSVSSYGQGWRPTKPTKGTDVAKKPTTDLTVTMIKLLPLSSRDLVKHNKTISVPVRVYVKNVGDVKITKSYDLTLAYEDYLYNDVQPFYITGRGRGRITRDLKPGESFNKVFYLQLPHYFSNKTTRLRAVVDANKNITEDKEKNNTLTTTVSIPKYK